MARRVHALSGGWAAPPVVQPLLTPSHCPALRRCSAAFDACPAARRARRPAGGGAALTDGGDPLAAALDHVLAAVWGRDAVRRCGTVLCGAGLSGGGKGSKHPGLG